jgi:hypothetical protein
VGSKYYQNEERSETNHWYKVEKEKANDTKHAWQKVVQNRQRCCNFFNFHADCTKFSIDIEHIILTNRAVFVFELFIFWRENDVTNMAPKI